MLKEPSTGGFNEDEEAEYEGVVDEDEKEEGVVDEDEKGEGVVDEDEGDVDEDDE